eukprot:scaffold100272_cov40-Phaeocystis_antarctica.AAC.1
MGGGEGGMGGGGGDCGGEGGMGGEGGEGDGGGGSGGIGGGGACAQTAHPAPVTLRSEDHVKALLAALGVEGGRAQELTNSQARRRDRARLAVAVAGGVVGRASAGTVYSARTDDGE